MMKNFFRGLMLAGAATLLVAQPQMLAQPDGGPAGNARLGNGRMGDARVGNGRIGNVRVDNARVGGGMMPVQVSSPVVNPDNTVTFNYSDPKANSVVVDAQFSGRKEMTKGENGVWTITLGPVNPDIYPYCFIVDGVTVMDPRNPDWFPNEKFKNSLVDVRGDKTLIHAIDNVPHGSVNYDYYHSETLDMDAPVIIYTPPFYDQNPDKKYPVFYLISGTTDTEETYFKVGRANFILDNLIAKGLAKEMIIVMPYGNPGLYKQGQRTGGGFGVDLFSTDFVNDLMPYVEKNYRTINDRDHRGIGGFSRGGGQALRNGLSNIDKFSYICSYSSYIGSDEFVSRYKNLYENPEKTNEMIHLFWLGVDKADFLYGGAVEFMELLDKYGIKTVTLQTEGNFGHTWMSAKHFLDDTMRRLFQE